MKIIYSNKKVEEQCTSLKSAKKLFGGNSRLAENLLFRIEYIKSVNTLRDIIVAPSFHFHSLRGKMEGFFAIDVKTRRDKWRLILQPLDDNEKIFDPCHIDEIAGIVKIVEIKEVSAHYE